MAKSGLFISYARTDGEAFATSLRARLAAEAPDVRVWQDRPEIEGGIGWWRQIEEALEQVEFLVIVMTPGVLVSETTRREWRAARQSGVCVFPVRGPGFEFDDARLPAWIRRVHVYDLEIQWATFVAHLRRGGQATRVPFMAPPLPAGLVARPREFGALRSLVLDARTGDAVAITTTVTGAGGFGKTTLAAALCHDDDVVTAFDDGILWTTLGQTPNVQAELTRCYAALTGERPAFVSIEDASQALAEKLEHKRCLVVVDDVWDPAHLRPFLRGGPTCTRLVTTRQARVAAEGRKVDVDEMSSPEAVALLIARLPEPPKDLEPLRKLSRRLGEWPLLLKLCASALRQRIERGDSLEGALRYVDRALEKRGVTAFDRTDTADRHEAVASTLGMSLDLLRADDRERCTELAVFPEDVAIPAAVVGELWGLDDLDTEETLARLHDGSLVEFDLGKGTVSLHDVTAECLAASLGTRAAQSHDRLLRAWPDFSNLPHRYAWRWLGHHLRGAGRVVELMQLLRDFGWLQRKLDETDIFTLLSDFESLPHDTELQTLEAVLRLSSHVLSKDKAQLASQLMGRIADPQSDLGKAAQAHFAARHTGWFCPLVPSLMGPGGALMRTLECPGIPAAVAVTPDGQWIVASTREGSLVAWELATGTLARTLQAWTSDPAAIVGPADVSVGFAVLPDGRILFTGRQGLTVWDPASGEESDPVVKLADGVGSLAVSPDGRLALLGSRRGALSLIDLGKGEVLAELVTTRLDIATGETILQRVAHRLGITSVAFSADGRRALTGSYDKTVRLWDVAQRSLVDSLYPPHEGIVDAVSAAPAAAMAASGGVGHIIQVWDLERQVCSGTLTGHTQRVQDVAMSRDGSRLLSGSNDKTVRLWDVAAQASLATLQGHSDGVVGVAFVPGERSAVSASRDGTVRVWQLEALQTRARTQEHEGWVQALVVTADGRRAITAGQDHRIRLWNTLDASVERVLHGHHGAVCALQWHEPSGLVVSGSYDCRVAVWRLGEEQPTHLLKGHIDAITGIAIGPRADKALSASSDGELILWDIARGRRLKRWQAHRRGVMFLAALPDWRLAVTGSTDGEVKLWDIGSRTCVRTIHAHLGGVTAGAVDPNGDFLLTGSGDGELRLWRLGDGELLSTVQAHAAKVRSLRFTRHGRLAISSSYDRYLRAWSIPDLQARAAFAADSAIPAADTDELGALVVAGDAQGCTHFLRLENVD